MISAFATLTRRRAAAVRADGDRGSLVLALLVMLVATSVAALILPLMMNSANAARLDDRRARQLAAAQSGIETTLARIRAAVDSTSAGAVGKLPCTDVAALTGAVLGSANLRYSVRITYYKSDPALLTGTLGTATAIANATLSCAVNGVTNATSIVALPAFAKITATGSDTPGAATTSSSRTVSATYVVKTSNSNIVGGLFRVNKVAGKTDLCLDAGAAPYTAGRLVTMQPCNASLPSQKWAYNSTLTISLVATRVLTSTGAISTDGLCVDGGASPEKSGTALVLQACGTATNLPQQRWSMNDNAGMQGTDDGAKLNSLCWAVANENSAGSNVVLGGQCSGTNGYDNVHSWQPDAAVGAGASGAAYNELVNYNQFGRCLDVTDQNVSASFLIAWPCKQNPDPTQVSWNQRWTLPAITNGVGTGVITTSVNNTTYCLNSPMSTAAGSYVTVIPCPASATAATTWTVRTKVATYDASYQIESTGSAAGNCMQPTDPTASTPDLFDKGTGISKIVIAACSKTTLQKWNAPPNVDAPSVKDQTEK